MRGRTRVRGIRLAVIERFCSLCLLASGVEYQRRRITVIKN
jgi:hypothetical protein